jgi:hypothetical protein
MAEEPSVGKVRLFNRKDLDIPVTKLTVEIYPSPDDTYVGYWYLDMPKEDDEMVNLSEIEALMDSVFAAGYQLEKLIHMVEYQSKHSEDDEDEDEL